ncbi:MAG: methylamine utilization protein MauJ [Pyrinomonadaceae bacterium]
MVTFVLCVPGQRVFQDHLNYPTLRDAGDSLLFVPSPIRDLRIQVSTSHGFAEIVFTMNKRSAISHAITKIWANNFEDAAAKAYDIVVPTLSHLSFRFDIALDTLGFEIKEERTDVMFYSYGLLGRAKLFNNLESFSSVLEYRRFFSAYREALNSPNTFYQALSFSKVTEGVLAHRIRQKRAAGSYVKDESGFLSTESFPETADEIGSDDDVGVGEFDIHLGKHFGDVHEHYRVLVRNAIAHLSKLDSVLDADTYEHISNCEKAVPVLKYMARRVLENDLATGKSREIEMTDG